MSMRLLARVAREGWGTSSRVTPTLFSAPMLEAEVATPRIDRPVPEIEGTSFLRSAISVTLFWASSPAPTTWTGLGMSWTFSARFWAVTTSSASRPSSLDWAAAGEAAIRTSADDAMRARRAEMSMFSPRIFFVAANPVAVWCSCVIVIIVGRAQARRDGDDVVVLGRAAAQAAALSWNPTRCPGVGLT